MEFKLSASNGYGSNEENSFPECGTRPNSHVSDGFCGQTKRASKEYVDMDMRQLHADYQQMLAKMEILRVEMRKCQLTISHNSKGVVGDNMRPTMVSSSTNFAKLANGQSVNVQHLPHLR